MCQKDLCSRSFHLVKMYIFLACGGVCSPYSPFWLETFQGKSVACSYPDSGRGGLYMDVSGSVPNFSCTRHGWWWVFLTPLCERLKVSGTPGQTEDMQRKERRKNRCVNDVNGQIPFWKWPYLRPYLQTYRYRKINLLVTVESQQSWTNRLSEI